MAEEGSEPAATEKPLLDLWHAGAATGASNDLGRHFRSGGPVDGGVTERFALLGENGTATQAEINALKSGLEQALTQIDANLVSQVFAERLPVVGNNLLAAAGGGAVPLHYVNALKAAIVSGLGTLAGGGTYTAAQVKGALDSALTAAGIGGMGATVDLSNASDPVLGFVTTRIFGALATPIKADLGLPNLGLKTSGTAQTVFAHTFNFSAGLDSGGFYVATAPDTTRFSVEVTTRLPGFSADAEMASIRFRAAEVPARQSDFSGRFNLMLKDPGNDGRLRLNELSGDLLDATLTADGGVKLDLDSILPAAAAMPAIGTELNIRWSFLNAVVNPSDDNTAFGFAPDVRFNNTTINLVSFFRNFALRMLNQIDRATQPLKPVIDVLRTPIPLLSDLGSKDVTLLDLAGLEPAQTAAIQGLVDISSLADKVAKFTTSDLVEIDLGSVVVLGDLRTALPKDLEVSIQRIPPSLPFQNGNLAQFLNGVGSVGGRGLSFPILTDFKNVGQLLLGQNVDLFAYKTGLGFDKEFSQYYPVLGFIGVKLGGHFGMAAQFDFGFDTQGLKDYAAGNFTDPDKVFNGFYARSTDDGGAPVTGFQIDGGVIAGIEANIGFAAAGVDGDLTATIDFALDFALDPTGGGKVRGGTLTTTPVGDLFDPAGELTTGLHAYLEIGISSFSIEFSFDSPRFTLLNFDGDRSNRPVIASKVGSDLALNVGPRSAQRLIGNLLDIGEAVSIRNVLDPLSGNAVSLALTAYKFSELHGFPARIVADGGEHADELTMAADVNIPAYFSGGVNRDILTGGAADDQLDGGEGPDVLSSNGGNDTLRGGPGNDRLIGGAGSDLIDGGDGTDTVAYTCSKTPVAVSLRTGLGTGGDAQGDVLRNVEVLIGSPLPFGDLSQRYSKLTGKPVPEGTGDTLEGSDGPDFIQGLGGADNINGGAGNDTLYGDSNQTNGPLPSATGFDVDTLRGGLGDDRLYGGEDDDDLDGGPGRDFLEGGPGNDHLRTLDPGSVDFLEGGEGINRLTADYSDKPVPVSFFAGQLTNFDFADGDLAHDFQQLGEFHTADFDDVIRLDGPADDSYANAIYTNGGNDLVYTGGGRDTIFGGAGHDTLYAGPGDNYVTPAMGTILSSAAGLKRCWISPVACHGEPTVTPC